jgi:uncharacterized Zn ribbon protein
MSKLYEVGFEGWTRIEADNEEEALGKMVDILNHAYTNGDEDAFIKDLNVSIEGTLP